MTHPIVRGLWVALAVAAFTWLGQRVAGAPPLSTTLWLPAGIAAVAYLRLGWPALIAVAVGSLAAQFGLLKIDVGAALVGAVVEVGQAALVVVLLRRVLPQGVQQVRDLVLLVAAVAVPVAAIAAYVLALLRHPGSYLDGAARAEYWLSLVFAHALGILLVVAAAEGWGKRQRDARSWQRLAVLIAAIVLVLYLAGLGSPNWVFAGFLLVAATALLDGLLGTALALAVFCLGSAALNANGLGPFDGPFELMSWLCVAGLGALALALEHEGRVDLLERLETLVRARTEVLQREVVRRRELEQELQLSAHHDALTGLPNRVLFLDRLHQAMADARRSRSGLAVCCVELDGFAEISDSHGRQASERLLAEFAQRVSARLRKSDTLARIGTDQFAVLAPRALTPEAATEVALRVVASLDLPLLADSHPIQLSASMGIALYPLHGDDEATLMARADAAMYEVKQRGQGGWMLYAGEGVVNPEGDESSPG